MNDNSIKIKQFTMAKDHLEQALAILSKVENMTEFYGPHKNIVAAIKELRSDAYNLQVGNFPFIVVNSSMNV